VISNLFDRSRRGKGLKATANFGNGETMDSRHGRGNREHLRKGKGACFFVRRIRGDSTNALPSDALKKRGTLRGGGYVLQRMPFLDNHITAAEGL